MKNDINLCKKNISNYSNQLPYTNGSGLTQGFSESPWIETYSGRRFCPTDPNPEAIVIQDIAHALSMQCRFSGHSSKFYSVAQHSVGVSYLCDAQDALWGLLHDASEAYLVDIPHPLKASGQFDDYIKFEKRMMEAVCQRFNLPALEPASVKKADKMLLAMEFKVLMKHRCDTNQNMILPFVIEPMDPESAKKLFLHRFFELQGIVVDSLEQL